MNFQSTFPFAKQVRCVAFAVASWAAPVAETAAQCTGCTISVAGGSASYSLTSGQKLCITSGTYTGTINSLASGATICIASGATFSPSAFYNINGTITNSGTANMPSVSFANGTVVNNSGRMIFANNLTFTGTVTFNNNAGAYARVSQVFHLPVNSTIVNNGYMLHQQNLNLDAGSIYTNNNRVECTVNFTPNGSFTNNGIVKTGGTFTFNTSCSPCTNNCTIYSQKTISNNSGVTQNNGTVILYGGAAFPDNLFQNSNIYTQGVGAKTQGIRFLNGTNASYAVKGRGTYRFTGNTENWGPFGTDGLGIIFYDTGLPSGVFDYQNPAPHSSVLKTMVAAIDTQYIPGTCSSTYISSECTLTAASLSASPTSICSGSSATLTASQTGGVSPFTYSWSGGLSNGNPKIVSPTSTTTYTVTVTDNAGCTKTASATVTVTTGPSITTQPSNGTICEGGSPFNMCVTASGTGLTYQWKYWDGALGWTSISGATNACYSVAPPVDISYYVDVFSGTCFVSSNVSSINVNFVTAGTVSGGSTICAGGNPAAFASTAAGTGDGTLTYQWQSNTASCSGAWANIFAANAAAYDPPNGLMSTTYYRRMSTSTLNSVLCSAASNCLTVTTNAAPNVTAGGNDLCLGQTLNLTASVAGGSSPFGFQWSGPMGFTNTAQNPSFLVLFAGFAGTYTVVATGANGCSGQATKAITVSSPPPAPCPVSN